MLYEVITNKMKKISVLAFLLFLGLGSSAFADSFDVTFKNVTNTTGYDLSSQLLLTVYSYDQANLDFGLIV